jgi:hypothetical protein
MQDLTHLLTSFAVEITIEGTIEPFVTAIIFIGMIVALMLPILAIPYIFIKMGSMAAKLQSMGNNMFKRTATGKNALGKAAQSAAGRQWDRKAGQWAARNDGSLKSMVGGYKTQRDFKRSQQSAAAKRLQEEGLERRIASDPRYRAAAGGTYADTVAQGIREKRLKEHEEQAEALLRSRNVYAPTDLRALAAGGVAGGIDASDRNDEVAQAISRVATRRLVSAQDSESLNELISDTSTSDKQMVYAEIQKQYSTAKGAGAHFVEFGRDATDLQTGWSQPKIAEKAAEAVIKLAPEKVVQQDGDTMKVAFQGFQAKQQQVQVLLSNTARTPNEDAQLNKLLGEMQSAKDKIAAIKANPNTYNAAKQAVQEQLEEIDKIV